MAWPIKKRKHTINIEANGAATHFELSKHKMDEILSVPIPVIVEEEFEIE